MHLIPVMFFRTLNGGMYLGFLSIIYCAHLAAFHAHFCMEQDNSDTSGAASRHATGTGGGSVRAMRIQNGNTATRTIPTLKR